jgi:hypothetical protein
MITSILVVARALAAADEADRPLPAGTELSIRLTDSLAQRTARVGNAVQGVLAAPVRVDGADVVPAGWTVRGTVTAVGRSGPPDHRPVLGLQFTELVDPSGRATPVSAKLLDVDNARETVDDQGRILGLPSHHVRPNKLEEILMLAAHLHPIALVAIEGAQLAGREATEAPIHYRAGVEMTLALALPASVAVPAFSPPAASAQEVAELAALVAAQPLRARAAKNGQPSDLTNLLLVGSQETVARGFVAAGWTRALPGGVKADGKAFIALATRHGYQPAPVSLLTLEGRHPDLVFEKQNNTLARRHHVRIWARDGRFRGQPVFVAAATHDVGIFFSPQEKTFTHRIDLRIDRERDKIVDDLVFADAVELRTLVERPQAPRAGVNAAGDRIETDGAVAALVLR